MITVKNVKKEFEKKISKKAMVRFYANDDISFEVLDGEILGILGPNGAGKTTLLRMIGGILKPTEGSIAFGSLNYESNELEIKRNIGYLSNNTKLYDSLSPYEMLTLCADIYALGKDTLDARIKEIAEILNMNDYLYSKISNLSTGQTQKINIARCILHDPKYYILDEATTGLDVVASQVILDFIQSEKERGKTFLYSTHYMEEAELLCNRCIMMNKGKVIAIGTPNEIKTKTESITLRDSFFALAGGDYNE